MPFSDNSCVLGPCPWSLNSSQDADAESLWHYPKLYFGWQKVFLEIMGKLCNPHVAPYKHHRMPDHQASTGPS